MTALNEMIEREASVLHEMARIDVSAACEKLAGADGVVLVGTGTSEHAAQLGAYLLRTVGVRARSVGAATLARWDRLDPGEATIVISHTGTTAFALRCRQAVLDGGRPLVSITGPDAGWPEAIMTPVAETSETYTVSYVAALAVIGRLAHALAGAPTGPEQLRVLAGRVEMLAAGPRIDEVAVPARSLAIVGAGPWAVTAREGALKVREGARMLAEGFDAERLLHGGAVPYGPADGLVALQPDADPDGLVAAVAAAAAQEGIPVATLTGERLGDCAFLDQIPMTVRLQLLASWFAELRRTNPDVAITGAWGGEPLWELGAP